MKICFINRKPKNFPILQLNRSIPTKNAFGYKY